ncbi:MAG: penicillin acylase family protein, partial [Acidobacteria bacterium]|nr:penicillin acylase family protein [Acidobacteriota bacterium]
MWRRNGEGRLAEVLGPEYVTRDRFARLLTFRGNWDEEFKRYHPEGRAIFESFARGVNASIQKALDENKVPVEFEIMGFRPQPMWTARTLLTRMPGWTLTRNASSEVQRALDVKLMGIAVVQELKPTDPEKAFTVPVGLDLEDIDPAILDITREANNLRWNLTPQKPSVASGAGAGGGLASFITPNPWLVDPDLGSNNWVVGGKKSKTGKPIIANDPHREVVNPALRWVGAEPGGAGYLGSLNVMQTKNWQTFNDALPRAWFIPS